MQTPTENVAEIALTAPNITAPVASNIPTAQELLQATRSADELRTVLERLEKDGHDTARLRLAYQAYLTSDPLRHQMPHDPRFRPYSPLSTDALRMIARGNDVAARCIAHLKAEVTKVPLKIVPDDEKDKSEDTRLAVKTATAWFSDGGGLGGSGIKRSVFEAQMIDDILVIGANALWLDFKTLGDRMDGTPSQIRAIDAATIQPLVTPWGFPEGDGKPAFAQWVQGVVTGTFERDQMIYQGLPSFARTDSPYFMSPTEIAAIQIYTLMRVDEWNRTWLTDGSGYRRYIKIDPTMTPQQATLWLDIVNMQTTNEFKERHKMGMLPGELTGEESRKDQDFDNYENTRITRICNAYGVNPASVGYHGREHKDDQQAAMDTTRDGMVAELLLWREQLYNRLLEMLGFGFLKVTEDLPAPNESPQERTTRQGDQIAKGIKTVNQVRVENGDEPVEGGDVLLLPSNLVPLSQLVAPPPVPGALPGTDGQNPGQNGGQQPAQNAASVQSGQENEDDISSDKTERVLLATKENVLNRGYEFSCVMAYLGEDAADLVRNFARGTIDPADLSEDGFELEPHITLRYGLHTEDAADVIPLLAKWETIRAGVRGVSIFAGSETGRPYDVVKIDVAPKYGDIPAVHARLGELEHTDSFPEYRPHITLAYVKAGTGAKYVSSETPLSGRPLDFDSVRFSSKNGTMTSIDLKSGAQREIKRALDLWERKSLNRLQRGQRAACNFDSDVLSNSLYLGVATALANAQSKEDVRSVFAKFKPGTNKTKEFDAVTRIISEMYGQQAAAALRSA